jgi:hypothetical protein
MTSHKVRALQRALAVATGVVAAALYVGPASAAQLVDSIYDCTVGSQYLGEIKIENGMFAGLAFDQKFGESYRFEIAEGGAINWGGPLAGFGDKYKVVSTVVSERDAGPVGFDITIQDNRGNSQTIICSPR